MKGTVVGGMRSTEYKYFMNVHIKLHIDMTS